MPRPRLLRLLHEHELDSRLPLPAFESSVADASAERIIAGIDKGWLRNPEYNRDRLAPEIRDVKTAVIVQIGWDV